MENITSLIPHREPFLFIDTLISVSEELIVGTRTFTEKDSFFKGHFPNYPIVPGVVLVEAMAQCGGGGVRVLGKIASDHLFFLATINDVKFRKPAVLGDTIRFEITNEKINSRMIVQSGKAFKKDTNTAGDILCTQARWMCLVGPQPH